MSNTLLLFLFPGCNAQMVKAVATDNKLPICHSEAVAYVTFVSGLVDDLDIGGVFSLEDRLELWKNYAGGTVPSGEWSLMFHIVLLVRRFYRR